MITQKQKNMADTFAKMYKQQDMFILPNCWNAMSAKVFENVGFEAIATTSAGIAFSLGCADGEHITIDDLETVVQQIVKRIHTPLSIDFERGYSDSPEEVKENAKKLIYAGAVGFNIEDGGADGTLEVLDKQLLKIKALVELKQELDMNFVINARTCTYLLFQNEDDKNMNTAVQRGNAFAQAGADCIFIPGVDNGSAIEHIVKSVDAPLNTLASPNTDFAKLSKLGVKRCSIGSFAARSVVKHISNIATELKSGKITTMSETSFDYMTANKMFS